ncbi:hypothetical protein [Gordonia sp. 'Campus']|uniref:hypothetical protein n=1 Tax=Gordonia sp. 'Campus' TaxID=2915824 RepID=UPI001EE4811B|nr:hypothetical protein [Gordonia sp. 'Campus']
MVTRKSVVEDLEQAMCTPVHFEPDPDDRSWYVGQFVDQSLYVRLGNFPDEELFSLYLGHGRWMDFTTFPANWTVASEGDWPPTARPRLPKGEFYE